MSTIEQALAKKRAAAKQNKDKKQELEAVPKSAVSAKTKPSAEQAKQKLASNNNAEQAKKEEQKITLEKAKLEQAKKELEAAKAAQTQKELQAAKAEQARIELETKKVEQARITLEQAQLQQAEIDLEVAKVEQARKELDIAKAKQAKQELAAEQADIARKISVQEQAEKNKQATAAKKSQQVKDEIAATKKQEGGKGKLYFDINLQKLEQNDFLIHHQKQRSLKEEFRQIKRKLLNNAFGAVSKTLDHPNLIMVTSALANEGKTYISINLALSIALEQDKTVLLVDADILKPSVLNEFGLRSKPGLIEYLLGNIEDAGDIIYQTNIDNLKIVPAGKPHHLSNELLASERMATLANELANRYPDRVVVFDSPPILGVTETPVLARLMGQALIAVEENKTSMLDVKNASSLLHDELAKGLVLNKALNSNKEIYGYYGYGYGSQPSD